MKRPQVKQIGEWTYWNDGSNLGDCEKCGEKAFSYNENGTLLCGECLELFHEEEDLEDVEVECEYCGEWNRCECFDE